MRSGWHPGSHAGSLAARATRALEPTVYEHTSTPKFLERLFDLPTPASLNHDTATPVGGNYEAAPARVGASLLKHSDFGLSGVA
jgi:hypothetical protein